METYKDSVTLTRVLLASQAKNTAARGDFTLLIQSIQLACKVVSTAVRKAGISGLYGLDGTVNVQGEEVKKLDLLSNDAFISAIRSSKRGNVLVSEEVPEIVCMGDGGEYSVVFDPLDGSSNIDCNVSVGSIFGVYRRSESTSGQTASEVLRPGTELAAAGYAMYGSATQLVISWGFGVHLFTLDPAIGEFILTTENLKIPSKPKTIYSTNEGNWRYFDDEVKRFIEHVKNDVAKPYSARYVGSMVADMHRTLLYGGIFIYPRTTQAPDGKLRLLYECNPMAYLAEQAGGKAVTNSDGDRILEIQPTSIHERKPVFIGCVRDVDLFMKIAKSSK